MIKQISFPFMKGQFRYRFNNVYVCDFEYATIGGELLPTSLAIKNISDVGSEVEFIWLRNPDGSVNKNIKQPYNENAINLMVVFFGEAEFSAIHEMGWKQPERIIDLYVACRNFNNGLVSGKNDDGDGVFSLLAMAKKYGCLTNYLEDDKGTLRVRLGNNLVGKDEIETVRRYNIEDVLVTERLFDVWEDVYDDLYEGGIIWCQELDRGQHTRIAAEAGRQGYPIDVESWDKFIKKFPEIISKVIDKAHTITNCLPDGKFNSRNFTKLVESKQLDSAWPKTIKGVCKSDQETLRIYEEIYEFKILKEALYLKGATKLRDLPIDRNDNRAKTMFSLFGSKTGRTTPSTSRHILNYAGCFIPFIRVPKDTAIIKVDYSQQEFLIGAVLANDEEMIEAYQSGDPYLSLGKRSGFIPQDADKSHPLRGVFKTVCLMVQYGAGTESMARQMKKPIETAEMALQVHQREFNKFWKWQMQMVDKFTYDCEYRTNNGWNYKLPPGSTFRQWGEQDGYSEATLKNWICQATGCEILRRAMRKLDDLGFTIIGLVHDEIIIEEPFLLHDAEAIQTLIQEAMEDASYEILGWRIKTDATIVWPGERFKPKTEEDMETFRFFAKEAGFDV